ncbi:MAG: NAD(P)H-binding protein [Actinomycetota bacterium]
MRVALNPLTGDEGDRLAARLGEAVFVVATDGDDAGGCHGTSVHLCAAQRQARRRAVERAGVHRFVLITGMGVGLPRPSEFSGGFWETYFGAKEISERRLRASSLLWTILQPGELLNSVGAGTVQLAPAGALPIGRVSRDDVAGVVAAVLERDQSEGHTWELVEGRDTIDDAVDEALRG